MSRPIPDHAEVSIDFPEKYYHGSFGHSCRFDVKADENGTTVSLDRTGDEKRHVSFHLHYYLLADIIAELGPALSEAKLLPQEREALRRAARKLDGALKKTSPKVRKPAKPATGPRSRQGHS